MKSVYTQVRFVHLLLGLFFIGFLLMYGVSSIQMGHPEWFDLEPAVTEQELRLAPRQDPQAIAALLIENHGLRGEMRQLEVTETGEVTFRIMRPGTNYQVRYSPEHGTTHVKTSKARFMGLLNRIHHIGGVHHEYGLLNAWGIFVGLTSAGLILLGLTGLYMWFKLHAKKRRLGAVLLVANLGVCIALIILMRNA